MNTYIILDSIYLHFAVPLLTPDSKIKLTKFMGPELVLSFDLWSVRLVRWSVDPAPENRKKTPKQLTLPLVTSRFIKLKNVN